MTTDLTTVFFKCLHTVHLYPRTTESFGKHCITASLASEALSLAHNSNSSEHDFQASHISTSQCLRSILIRSHCQFPGTLQMLPSGPIAFADPSGCNTSHILLFNPHFISFSYSTFPRHVKKPFSSLQICVRYPKNQNLLLPYLDA